MQFLDMNFYMAEDILTKVDRASMAVSLEVRAPFLDPRVAQFAASLPLEYKLKGNKGKYILKKAVAPLLPKNILQRPKKGFGIPIAEWLKGQSESADARFARAGKIEKSRFVRRKLRSEIDSGTRNKCRHRITNSFGLCWFFNFGSIIF